MICRVDFGILKLCGGAVGFLDLRRRVYVWVGGGEGREDETQPVVENCNTQKVLAASAVLLKFAKNKLCAILNSAKTRPKHA